jgi:hypothetical protein
LSSNLSATYSCIEDCNDASGTGNICGDANNPFFVDAEANDFHLDANSPCIDAGTNTGIECETDIDGEERRLDDPEVNDTGNGEEPVVDMGADEFYWSPADFDDDGDVNFVDYAIFAESWKTEDASVSLDCDNDLDYNDLGRFCMDWLWRRGQPKGFARSMGGGGLGEGMYAAVPAEQQSQSQPEGPDPERIEQLISDFEEILIDEKGKEGLSEEQWEKYVEHINNIIKWLKEVLEEALED